MAIRPNRAGVRQVIDAGEHSHFNLVFASSSEAQGFQIIDRDLNANAGTSGLNSALQFTPWSPNSTVYRERASVSIAYRQGQHSLDNRGGFAIAVPVTNDRYEEGRPTLATIDIDASIACIMSGNNSAGNIITQPVPGQSGVTNASVSYGNANLLMPLEVHPFVGTAGGINTNPNASGAYTIQNPYVLPISYSDTTRYEGQTSTRVGSSGRYVINSNSSFPYQMIGVYFVANNFNVSQSTARWSVDALHVNIRAWFWSKDIDVFDNSL